MSICIENVTSSWQSFTIDNMSFKLEPKGMRKNFVNLSDEQAKSPVVERMLDAGVVRVKDKVEAANAAKEAIERAKEEREERKIEVVPHDSNTKSMKRVVQCAATKKNGDRCSLQVQVDEQEFDPDTPYFCHRHKNEKADDYDRVGNGWVKREQA